MSEPGVRPGGLTALAVINFVWAAFTIISGFAALSSPVYMPALAAQAEKAASNESRPEKQKEAKEAAEHLREASSLITQHKDLVLLSGAARLFLGLLLILSGIGYLKLRRFLGRTLGLIYATLAVLWECAVILWVQKEMAESPGISALISFIYPAITIFALLVTFRDDFTNP